MRSGGVFGKRKVVVRALGDFSVSMDSTRSRRYLVRRTKLIMCIIELVYRLVVAIREDCWFAFVGIHIRMTRLGRFPGLKHVRHVFWHSFELVSL